MVSGVFGSTSMASATPTNLGSITLTPGIWMIYGQIYFNGTGNTTVAGGRLSISSTSATEDFTWSVFSPKLDPSANPTDYSLTLLRPDVVATTTTFYLVGYSIFTGGSMASLSPRGKFIAVRVG